MREVVILEDASWYHRSYSAGQRVTVGEREYWDLAAMGKVRVEDPWERAEGPCRDIPLAGRHAGETVFVLGNGPSLKEASPDALSKVTTIGVNRAPEYHDPDYLVWLDSKFLEENAELVSSSRAEKFAAAKIRAAHPYRRFKRYSPRPNQPLLSGNYETGLFWSYTSVFPAINLAWIFGASAIVLCGVDLLDRSHFYSNEGRGEPFHNSQRIIKHMQRLADFADKRGLKIINASSESKIRCFEIIDANTYIERMEKNGELLKRR